MPIHIPPLIIIGAIVAISGTAVAVAVSKKKPPGPPTPGQCAKISQPCASDTPCCDKLVCGPSSTCIPNVQPSKYIPVFLLKTSSGQCIGVNSNTGNIGLTNVCDWDKEYWSIYNGVLRYTFINSAIPPSVVVHCIQDSYSDGLPLSLTYSPCSNVNTFLTNLGSIMTVDYKYCAVLDSVSDDLICKLAVNQDNPTGTIFNIITPQNCSITTCQQNTNCCPPFQNCLSGTCQTCFIDPKVQQDCEAKGNLYVLQCDPDTQQAVCMSKCDQLGIPKPTCQDNCNQATCHQNSQTGQYFWSCDPQCGPQPSGCSATLLECTPVGNNCVWQCKDPNCNIPDPPSTLCDTANRTCTMQTIGGINVWYCTDKTWWTASKDCLDLVWKCDTQICDPNCSNQQASPNCSVKCDSSSCPTGQQPQYKCDSSTNFQMTCDCATLDTCSFVTKPSCSDATCLDIPAIKCPNIFGSNDSGTDWRWVCPSSGNMTRCEEVAINNWTAKRVPCDPNAVNDCKNILQNICKNETDPNACVNSFLNTQGQWTVPIVFDESGSVPLYPTINLNNCRSNATEGNNTIIAGKDQRKIINNPAGHIANNNGIISFIPQDPNNHIYYYYSKDPNHPACEQDNSCVDIICMVPDNVKNQVCNNQGCYEPQGQACHTIIPTDPTSAGEANPNTDDLLNVGLCLCNSGYGGVSCDSNSKNCFQCAYDRSYCWNLGTPAISQTNKTQTICQCDNECLICDHNSPDPRQICNNHGSLYNNVLCPKNLLCSCDVNYSGPICICNTLPQYPVPQLQNQCLLINVGMNRSSNPNYMLWALGSLWH